MRRIALLTLIVALVSAAAAWLVVPEFRKLIGLASGGTAADKKETVNRENGESPPVPMLSSGEIVVPKAFENITDAGAFLKLRGVRSISLGALGCNLEVVFIGDWPSSESEGIRQLWTGNRQLWLDNAKSDIIEKFSNIEIAVIQSPQSHSDARITGTLTATLTAQRSRIAFVEAKRGLAQGNLHLELTSTATNELIAVFDETESHDYP